MREKNAEELYASLQRGMRATADLSVVLPLLDARKETLIVKAVADFNSRNPETRMTERDALLFVAALAENQRLKDDLEAAERQGRRDGQKLTQEN